MSRGMLQALVRLPGDSEDAARPGKVEFLDNAVQNATGTVNLRATIPNADRHFWPGQFVNVRLDRKSTRLNSSHGYISYAVFCLKKKNKMKADWAGRQQ